MRDNTARLFTTLGIWFSFTLIMVAGICRMNFNGMIGLLCCLVMVGIVGLAAAISTGFVWKGNRNTSPLTAESPTE